MRALAANAGAHFPLIVRSRFCLCLSESAFLPFVKEFFQISQCIAGTGHCLVHALLEDHLPLPIQLLNSFQGGHCGSPCAKSALSAVYSMNFYEFANGCFICRWLARPHVPTCEHQ
jgi:hypothetical protein